MPKKPTPKPPKTTPKTTKLQAKLPVEYDRRGTKLPARTLVGGIITPV